MLLKKRIHSLIFDSTENAVSVKSVRPNKWIPNILYVCTYKTSDSFFHLGQLLNGGFINKLVRKDYAQYSLLLCSCMRNLFLICSPIVQISL